MGHENLYPHQVEDPLEKRVRDSALKKIPELVNAARGKRNQGQILSLPPQNLEKIPVNESMDVEERLDNIHRNNVLYYQIIHDPALKEEGINPDIQNALERDIEYDDGWYHMSSVPLGEEASLVRMTFYNKDDEPTEYRAHLWLPASKAEEYLMQHSEIFKD